MRILTLNPRRAAGLVAIVAAVVYGNTLWNGWAGDDTLIVLRNSRVHGLLSALAAWRQPYWPPPLDMMGLYRPLTVLSYGVDWWVAGGQPWLFHLTNVLLHAGASALTVAVASAWLPTAGALAAGLVFAVHPVHVEAVSNVVGRAELLAAAAMLGAILSARGHRHAAGRGAATAWFVACVVLVAVGLLSKEHAAVVLALLGLDQLLDPVPARRGTLASYLAIAAVTGAWFLDWRNVVGHLVESGATSAFFGVSLVDRWFTMLAGQLHVVGVLAWPVDLRPDYSPQTIPIRHQVDGLVLAGAALSASVLALAAASVRRARAIAFGVFAGVATYLPTSNLLFVSGVMLAERALYLAVLAPALAAGWLVTWSADRSYQRAVLAAGAAVLLAFSVRSWTRTPFWKDPPTAIIEDALEHPENYRSRIHLGEFFESRRDTARALAEFLAAGALHPGDPFVAQFTVRDARALGRPDLALSEALRAFQLGPDDWRLGRQLAESRLEAGLVTEALAGAQADLDRNPASGEHRETVRLISARAPRR